MARQSKRTAIPASIPANDVPEPTETLNNVSEPTNTNRDGPGSNGAESESEPVGEAGNGSQWGWWKNEKGEWCLGDSCFMVRLPTNEPPIYEFDPVACEKGVARAFLGSLKRGGGKTEIKVPDADD